MKGPVSPAKPPHACGGVSVVSENEVEKSMAPIRRMVVAVMMRMVFIVCLDNFSEVAFAGLDYVAWF